MGLRPARFETAERFEHWAQRRYRAKKVSAPWNSYRLHQGSKNGLELFEAPKVALIYLKIFHFCDMAKWHQSIHLYYLIGNKYLKSRQTDRASSARGRFGAVAYNFCLKRFREKLLVPINRECLYLQNKR